MGIEVNGVITTLVKSAAEQFFAVESLNDVFVIGAATTSNGANSFEETVSDGYAWSGWQRVYISTGTNALPTLTVTNPNLETGTWTKLSNIVSANDADGDSIEGIRFSNIGYFDAYSVSLGGYLEDSYYDELSGMYVASSYDLPSLDDVYIKSNGRILSCRLF